MEIHRTAAAYYENLPVMNKRYARYIFSSIDKNGDGQINLKEYLEYLSKENKTALAHPSLFRALDKNNNGSLDFEEVIVLYYITQSGRSLFCKSCKTFLTDVHSVALNVSLKMIQSAPLIFAVIAMVEQSSVVEKAANGMKEALQAYKEKLSGVLEEIDIEMIDGVVNLAVSAGCIIM